MRNLLRNFFLFSLLLFMLAIPACGGKKDGPDNTTDPIKNIKISDAVNYEYDAFDAELQGKFNKALQLYRAAMEANLLKLEHHQFESGESRELIEARCESLLFKLIVLSDELFDYADFSEYLEKLCREVNPVFGAKARYFMARGFWSDYRLDDAQDCIDELGFVTDWLLIGPFDNERGQGVDQPYPPEEETDFTAVYTGKDGHNVSWFPFRIKPNFGEIKLSEMMRPNQQALAYAAAYIHSPKKQPVAFRLSSDESIKIWLNDGIIHFEDVTREGPGFDQKACGGVLEEGWNRVLVKSCQKEGPWEFSLRITNPDGNKISGLTFEKNPETVANLKTPVYGPAELQECDDVKIFTGAESAFKRLLGPQSRAIDFYHAAYFHYMSRSHDSTEHPDIEYAKMAITREPENPMFRHQLAVASEQHAKAEADADSTDMRLELERAIALSDKNANSRLHLAQYYFNQQFNAEKALELCNEALAINPLYTNAALLKIQTLYAQSFEVEAFLQAQALAKNNPRHIPALLFYARLLMEDRKLNAALDAYQQAAAIDSSINQIRERIQEILNQKGEVDKALKGYLDALKYDPYALQSYLRRAEIYESRDETAQALAECEKALAICPEDHEILARAGHYCKWLGDEEKAARYWDRALALYPNFEDLKKYVQFLNSDKLAFHEKFTEDAAAVLKTALPLDEAKKKYPGEIVVQLLEKQVSKVNGDGTNSQLFHRFYQILSDKGVEALDQYSVPRADYMNVEFLAARVHHDDGSVSEGQVGSVAVVDLPRINVGDVIEVQYRVDVMEKSFFGSYFGETVFFANFINVNRFSYSVVAPKTMQLYFNQANLKAEKTVRQMEKEGWTVYGWDIPGEAKLRFEPAMPGPNEFAPMVQVSTYKDWNEFAKWYWNLIRKQHEASPEMKAKVKELTANLKTDEEKVRAVYNWVVTKITYNDAWEFGVHGYKPYNASTIFTRLRGDCKDKAILINTMLDVIGIQGYPVLIAMAQDYRRQEEDLTLPLMGHFNHCISYIPSLGKDGIFLDGTATYSPFDCFPVYDQGAKVLIVKPDGGEIKRIPYNGPERESFTEKTVITLNEKGEAALSSSATAGGSFGTLFRAALQTPQIQTKYFETFVYGEKFPGSRVAEMPAFSDLADLNKTVTYDLKLVVPHCARKDKNGALTMIPNAMPMNQSFRLMGMEGQTYSDNFAPIDKRETDLILTTPWSLKSEVDVKIPKGFIVAELPDDVELKSKYLSAAIKYKKTDKGFSYEKIIVQHVNRVPKADYADFRKLCNDLDRAEAEDLIIKPNEEK